MKKRKIFPVLLAIALCVLLSCVMASAAMLGDIDGDTKITSADARLALRMAVKLDPETPEKKAAADINGDGVIKSDDARLILRAAVGLDVRHSHSYGEWVVTTAPTCTADGVKTAACSCSGTITEAIPAVGHIVVNDAAKAATCTEAGLSAGTHCSVCGEVLTAQAPLAALGHTYSAATTAPSCTKGGYTVYTCLRCNDSYTANELAPLGHNWNSGKITTQATCVSEGVNTYTCSYCLNTRTEAFPIDPENHASIETVGAKQATCVENGATGTVTCTACSTLISENEVIPATGVHDYEFKTVDATCVSEGYTAEACKNCSEYKNYHKTADPLGHNYSLVQKVEPTCTADGYTMHTCSRCEAMYSDEIVPALGHDWKDGSVITEASCTEDGLKTQTCSRCEEQKEVTVFATGHIYRGTNIPGDCENKSYTLYTCTACEDSYKDDYTDYVHQFQHDNASSSKATCTATGKDTEKCRKCDATQETVLELLTHDIPFDTKQATCTEDGYVTYNGTCSMCKKTFMNETVVLPKTGHTLGTAATCTVAQKCTRCGETIVEALGHDYSTSETSVMSTGSEGFFCTRCGNVRADKLDAYNTLVNRIKSSAFTSGNKVSYFSRTSMTTVYTRFDFGIYTNAVKNLYDTEMDSAVDTYTVLRKNYPITYNLQIAGSAVTSRLTNNSIDDVKIEKLTVLRQNEIFNGLPDSYKVGSNTYDLTQYKNKSDISTDIIKVIVDIKNETYTMVKNMDGATALSQAFNLDIRDEASEYYKDGNNGVITETESDGSYTITMKMGLKEIYSDGTVTFYFDAATLEPIAAVYNVDVKMDQTVEMSFKIGLFSLDGYIDPTITTNYKYVYLFSGYYS